jgi:hypothetical protein
MTSPSVYNHILPTQTYQSQNKPQYVSVYDQGFIPSPLEIASPDGSATLVISEANNGVATFNNSGTILLNTQLATSEVQVKSDKLQIGPRATNFSANGELTIANSSTTPGSTSAYYSMYVAGSSSGGLTKDHLETWAYTTGSIVKCIDIDPSGNVGFPVQINTNQILLAGKPVAKASKVAWVGLGGVDNDTITIPISTAAQNVSANFAVVAGHTYRVTAQFRLECEDDTDVNAIMYVNITSEPNASVESIGMVGVKSAGTSSGPLDNTSCYSALFVPTASVATCRLIAGNTSATDVALLKISSVGQPQDSPNILLEDLGIL